MLIAPVSGMFFDSLYTFHWCYKAFSVESLFLCWCVNWFLITSTVIAWESLQRVRFSALSLIRKTTRPLQFLHTRFRLVTSSATGFNLSFDSTCLVWTCILSTRILQTYCFLLFSSTTSSSSSSFWTRVTDSLSCLRFAFLRLFIDDCLLSLCVVYTLCDGKLKASTRDESKTCNPKRWD